MIVGGGLAGLIAGHMLPHQEIWEAAPEPESSHKALLRFRSDAVARVTGVEFRRVRVRKGIFYADQFVEPNIAVANEYSRKCLNGRMAGERSIWDLTPVERWIAPEDFHERLVEHLKSRLSWNAPADFTDPQQRTGAVSTVPLPVVTAQLGIPAESEFARAPITVQRFRVPKCDVHQTVYFPTPLHSLYRASITGDLLICELAGVTDEHDVHDWRADVRKAFRFSGEPVAIERVQQRYGKISPIDEQERRALVARLTQDYDIFSLGRFATWRNILLDDVVQDVDVIKQLMKASAYERKLQSLKRN